MANKSLIDFIVSNDNWVCSIDSELMFKAADPSLGSKYIVIQVRDGLTKTIIEPMTRAEWNAFREAVSICGTESFIAGIKQKMWEKKSVPSVDASIAVFSSLLDTRSWENMNILKFVGTSSAHANKRDLYNILDKMMSDNKWLCPIKIEEGDDSFYSISKAYIAMYDKQAYKTDISDIWYGDLLHNMAHSTGAESQLNRMKPSSFGSIEYAREELIAELTAEAILESFGSYKTIRLDSAPYIKAWIDGIKSDEDFLPYVFAEVKKAYTVISEYINNSQL